MTTVTRAFDYTVRLVASIRSAVAVAAAVEARRTPDPQDLRRLGIDPRSYLSMGLG